MNDEHADAFEGLDALLTGPPPDFGAEPEPPPDPHVANGRMRALAALRRKVEAEREVANVERELIDQWLMRPEAQARADRIAWLEASLTGWHALKLDDYGGGPRSTALPAGTIRAKAQQPQVDINAEVFLPWALKHRPDLVNRPAPPAARPDAAEVRKLVRKLDLSKVKPGERVTMTVQHSEPDVTEGHPFDEPVDIPLPGVTVTVQRPKLTVETD